MVIILDMSWSQIRALLSQSMRVMATYNVLQHMSFASIRWSYECDCNIVAILSTLEISDLIVCLFKLKPFVVSISNRASLLSFGFLLLSES